MIHIEPVNRRTFGKVLDMKLSAEQNRFVAPNIVSIAQAWLNYAEARPFAICNGDEVVGFIMLDWDEGERTVGVWRFMIATEHQHKGYGRQALEIAMKLVRDAGKFDMIYLDYVPGNTVARELYYSLGFRENGEIEDGEIIMTLPLTDTPKLGMCIADEDDLKDILALIEAEKAAGASVPAEFTDKSVLEKNVADGGVKRFTIMGKTIGIGIGEALLMNGANASYTAEARSRLIG